jgi:hypothetical protein
MWESHTSFPSPRGRGGSSRHGDVNLRVSLLTMAQAACSMAASYVADRAQRESLAMPGKRQSPAQKTQILTYEYTSAGSDRAVS